MRRAVGALIRKDVRLELRSPRVRAGDGAVLAVAPSCSFTSRSTRRRSSGNLASGILWVTLLFAAVLGINRLFVSEREEGGFDGFLLAPVDRTSLFVAKALVLFAFLAAVEVFVLAAFAILLLGPSPWPPLPELALVLLLADIGIAVVGTLVAAIAIQTRARDLLVPLIALPLSVPLVIAGARATAPLLAEGGAGALEARWLLTLGLYDLVFGLLAYAIFDFLLED